MRNHYNARRDAYRRRRIVSHYIGAATYMALGTLNAFLGYVLGRMYWLGAGDVCYGTDCDRAFIVLCIAALIAVSGITFFATGAYMIGRGHEK